MRMLTIGRIVRALRPAGGGVLALLLAALVVQSLVGPGVAAILGWLVHRLTTGADLVHAAVGPLAAFGGLLLLGYLAEAAVTPLELRARARIDGRHRSEVMRLAMGTPTIDVLDDPETQTLIREVRADPRNVVEYTPADGALSVLRVLVGLIGAVAAAVVLATYAWWMVPLVLVPALLVSYLESRRTLAVVGTLRYGYQEEAYADVWRQAAISPSAGKDIRVFGFAHWMVDRMQHHIDIGNAPLWNLRRRYLRTGWTTFVLIGAGLVPAYAAVTLSASRGHTTVATQTAVFAAGWAIFLALPDLDHVHRIVGAGAVLRSFGVLRQRLAPAVPTPTKSIVDKSPLVRFEGVSFTYPHATDPVLHQLDLEIRPGELLAIVGLNGAGKSTLIKLLAGLSVPSAGRITADGVDIATLDPNAWRRRLSIVFQDFVRYPFTAEENIRLGRDGDPSTLDRAVAEAGAEPTLDRLPAGPATPLSRGRTGGVDLSGGQWQQVVLARALYAVQTGAGLLVLDEPTAHLDVRTEFEVFDRLVGRGTEVGVVLISHRLSTVRRADRIVLLDGGRITESGTHDELVALGGTYARMFDIQAERFRRGFDDRIEEVAP
jgi:ATP-binding cassette subfamily B protein